MAATFSRVVGSLAPYRRPQPWDNWATIPSERTKATLAVESELSWANARITSFAKPIGDVFSATKERRAEATRLIDEQPAIAYKMFRDYEVVRAGPPRYDFALVEPPPREVKPKKYLLARPVNMPALSLSGSSRSSLLAKTPSPTHTPPLAAAGVKQDDWDCDCPYCKPIHTCQYISFDPFEDERDPFGLEAGPYYRDLYDDDEPEAPSAQAIHAQTLHRELLKVHALQHPYGLRDPETDDLASHADLLHAALLKVHAAQQVAEGKIDGQGVHAILLHAALLKVRVQQRFRGDSSDSDSDANDEHDQQYTSASLIASPRDESDTSILSMCPAVSTSRLSQRVRALPPIDTAQTLGWEEEQRRKDGEVYEIEVGPIGGEDLTRAEDEGYEADDDEQENAPVACAAVPIAPIAPERAFGVSRAALADITHGFVESSSDEDDSSLETDSGDEDRVADVGRAKGALIHDDSELVEVNGLLFVLQSMSPFEDA